MRGRRPSSIQAARPSSKATGARPPPGHSPAIAFEPLAQSSASDGYSLGGQSMATATDSRDRMWYSTPAARMMAASASISVW